jgi:hypothetical protein
MAKRSIKPRDESNPLREHPLGRDYALQSVFAMFAPGYRNQQGVLAVPVQVVEGEPPTLHLLSPNEAALQRVKEILATPGAKVEGFAIDAPPERDVQRWGRALAGRGGPPALPAAGRSRRTTAPNEQAAPEHSVRVLASREGDDGGRLVHHATRRGARALPAHEDVADDGGVRPGRGARRRGLQGGEP